uniref:Uncharacterized protein n=1 Tax=viral metagenome TaxID=1070528 RepID=A0A6C0KXB4_9ZZZZ
MNTSTFSINDMFARLVAQYPTYDAFRTYVTSLGIQVNAKDGDQLVMLRYNRAPAVGASVADLTNPVTQMFRSVVWDTMTNRPVFVAPMKSQLLLTMPLQFTPNIIVEEFVDGVMVNLFFDKYQQKWRLATRSRLDADNKFFDHTFAELFAQAWVPSPNGQPDFSGLNKEYGYSFVLQHPLNRIVVPVMAPSLTCVEITVINPLTVSLQTMPSPTTMFAPRRFSAFSMVDCHALLTNVQQFEGIRSQGIVIRDIATGHRWKMRTDMYNQIRKFRGNHSKLEYTWFENFKNGTLETYLAYYPEERVKASAALAQWTKVVSETYNHYVHVFKVRDCPKAQIPVQYKGILFDLHGQYLARLAPQKQSLTWQEHQAIMGRQDLKRMVFLATYKAPA